MFNLKFKYTLNDLDPCIELQFEVFTPRSCKSWKSGTNRHTSPFQNLWKTASHIRGNKDVSLIVMKGLTRMLTVVRFLDARAMTCFRIYQINRFLRFGLHIYEYFQPWSLFGRWQHESVTNCQKRLIEEHNPREKVRVGCYKSVVADKVQAIQMKCFTANHHN